MKQRLRVGAKTVTTLYCYTEINTSATQNNTIQNNTKQKGFIMKILSLSVFTILWVLSGVAQSGVYYKCENSSGKVTFQDRPCRANESAVKVKAAKKAALRQSQASAAKSSQAAPIDSNASSSDIVDMDKAVRGGDISGVTALLAKGVSPSIPITEGRNATWKHSPLILAVKAENIELVKLLIKHKADVNYANFGSATALKEAVKKDNQEITSLLINAGADVNFVDENEVPVLFWAVSQKSKKVIPLLIAAGADPNKPFNSMFYGKHSVKTYFSQPGKSDPSVLKLLD